MPLSPDTEKAVARCVEAVLADRPLIKSPYSMYRWRRRWRKAEYELYVNGGLYGTANWYVLKHALDQIGGFW
jgi:hypothetical protein